MAAPQDLKIWAEQEIIDGVTNTPQRRVLNGEEFNDGILNLVTFTAQQYNSLMFIITTYSNPFYASPTLLPTTEGIPTEALEMDGQAITTEVYPNLFLVYGANLPDIVADAPSGFTYIVRKS